jgi:hypothetical protein
MRIGAYAYTSKQEQIAQERRNRYKEIKDLGLIEIKSTDRNLSQVTYKGNVKDESLNALDVALLCDRGSAPFGGICNLYDDGAFICTIYTD